MDPFFAIIGGGVLLLFIGVVMLGLWYPGSGTAQLDWKTPRELVEEESKRDADDVAQMLAGVNERRRARGERELRLREQTVSDAGLDD